MLKTSELFIKDSLEQQVWRRVQTANSVYHFSHKNQPQMHSKLRGWQILVLSLLLCPWEKWGRRHTVERRWGVDSVSRPWGTPSKTEYVWRHGQHCSEEWSGLCRPPVQKEETIPPWALPHLYNIWHYAFATSRYICFLISVHNVTGTVPPPPN